MRDPVCGMDIVAAQSAATSVYDGQTYHFCARACKERFDKDPERYLHPAQQLSQYARNLYEALGRLSNVFHGPTTRSGLGKDLTEAEWEALRLLGHQGKCMMRELAEACDMALSTMTGVIDRLVKKGLVQRRHSTSDRRVVMVQLSERGKLAYEERLDADMRMVLTMLQALTPEEQAAFMTLIQKIVHSLS